MSSTIHGQAAGVPFVAVSPPTPRHDAPIVAAWHLMDPPCTETAFAAALPMTGLDAWRIYLALPMSPHRLGEGGLEAVQRAGMDDAVRKLKVPIVEGAAAEFPNVFADIRRQLDIGDGPLGLLGGSDGSAVLGQVLLGARERGLDVSAAVLVSPVSKMKNIVDAVAKMFGFEYPWDDQTLAIAARHDLVARAAEIAAAVPAVRVIVGADDDEGGVVQPAKDLVAALQSAYHSEAAADLHVIEAMGHALAERPGIDPAPPTESARQVDALTTEWFIRHLIDTLAS